jgi:hypothetical protein
MGKGIDMARAAGAGIHADVLDDFKDQLLIVFLKRLKAAGQSLDFPVAEVDATGNDLASFSICDGVFHFELSKKS